MYLLISSSLPGYLYFSKTKKKKKNQRYESLGGVLTRPSSVGRTSSARFSKRQDKKIMNNLAWKGYPEMSGMLCKIDLIRSVCRALSNEVLNITEDLTDLRFIPLCHQKPI